VAKLLAYTECSVQVMLAHADPRFCDCNKIIATADIPMGQQPDKQKELSLKADWKYTAAEYFTTPGMITGGLQKRYPDHPSSFLSENTGSVFQPPRAC